MARSTRWDWFVGSWDGHRAIGRVRRAGVPTTARKLRFESLEDRRLLATFMVTNILDGPVSAAGQLPGSLRQAIFDSNALPGHDTIEIDSDALNAGIQPVDPLPEIQLSAGTLVVTDSLTFDGTYHTPDFGFSIPSEIRQIPISGQDADPSPFDGDPSDNSGDGIQIMRIDDGSPGTFIDVIFDRVFFEGGDFSGFGGGVYSSENLTLSNSEIRANATLGGGGVYLSGGTASITDSSIWGWSNSGSGGGLVVNNSSVQIDNVQFRGHAATDGKCIVQSGGSVTITNSDLSFWYSAPIQADGGAIWQDGGMLSISDTLIEGVNAFGNGGAIFSRNSTVSVVDSRIQGGIDAGLNGGAIMLENSTANFNSLHVSGATAGGDGGAIYVVNSDLTIADSVFDDNEATGAGGALAAIQSVLTIAGSVFTNNQAAGNGGAIFLDHGPQSMGVGTTTISDTQIRDNSSDLDGGGVAALVGPGSEVVLVNTELYLNRADNRGGGLYSRNYAGATQVGETRLLHVGLYSNVSDADSSGSGAGGGISLERIGTTLPAFEISHTALASNTDQSGVAPDLHPTNGNPTVTYSLIRDNVGSGIAESHTADANGNLIGSSSGAGVLSPQVTFNGRFNIPLPASPLIDAGNPTLEAGIGETPSFDARGVSFDRVLHIGSPGVPRIDIGPIEFNDSAIRKQLLSDLLASNGGDGSQGVILTGGNTLDLAGTSVSVVGDVNGDGYDDMVVGVPGYGSPDRPGSGAAYLVFGGSNLDAERPLAELLQTISQSVFTDNFTGGASASWTVDGGAAPTAVTPIGARQYLGQLGNQTAALNLIGLPAHEQVTFKFDLFAIGPWDGNHPTDGERWQLKADGTTLVDTSFSNVTTGAANRQDFGAGPRIIRDAFISGDTFSINGSAEPNEIGNSFGGLRSADFLVTQSAALSQRFPDWDVVERLFTAIISGDVSARDRFDARGAVVNVNGDLLARDHDDLWDGTIANGIKYNESGQLHPSNTIFFTGSNNLGLVSQNAQNWSTSSSGQVVNIGLSQSTLNWLNQGAQSASQGAKLVGVSPELATVDYASGTGASERKTLGYSTDAVYTIEITFDHTSSSLALEMLASSLLADERWGIDNVSVTVHDAPISNGGSRVVGAMAGDGIGERVASVGDFNGDGLADFIVSPVADASDTVYLVLGQQSYSGEVDLASASSTVAIAGLPSTVFRTIAVSSAGDVNADGLDDLIIGVESASLGGGGIAPPYYGSVVDGPRSGAAYVVFGRSDGIPATIDVSSLNGTNGFVIRGAASGANLGASVAAAGDVNGDGIDDIVIGAPGGPFTENYGRDEQRQGLVFVVYGNVNGFSAVLDVNALSGSAGITIEGTALLAEQTGVFQTETFGELGRTVSGAGDFDGDGYNDLLLTAPYFDVDGVVMRGKAYVVFGSATLPTTLHINDLDGMNGFGIAVHDAGVLLTQARNQEFGLRASAAGDVNGDGYDDVFIGGPKSSVMTGNTGNGYIFFGGPDLHPPAIDLNDLSNSPQQLLVLTGVGSGDRTGVGVDGGGDVNGDGLADVAVGAPQRHVVSVNSAGTAFLVYGNDVNGLLDLVGTAAGETLTGTSADELIVAGEGDDTIISGGGADAMSGGQGNDRFVLSSGVFRRVDGGTGEDTITLATGLNLDLTAIADNRIQDVEKFDLTASGNNLLTLNQNEVLRLSQTSNTVTVLGSTSDVVDQGTGWIFVGTETTGEGMFNILKQGEALLRVSAGATLVQPTLTAGDYNQSGTVDGADYVVWRKTLGNVGSGLQADSSGPTFGVPNGVVDQFDYDFWRAKFGNSAPTSGAGSGGAAAIAQDAVAASDSFAAVPTSSEPIAAIALEVNVQSESRVSASAEPVLNPRIVDLAFVDNSTSGRPQPRNVTFAANTLSANTRHDLLQLSLLSVASARRSEDLTSDGPLQGDAIDESGQNKSLTGGEAFDAALSRMFEGLAISTNVNGRGSHLP